MGREPQSKLKSKCFEHLGVLGFGDEMKEVLSQVRGGQPCITEGLRLGSNETQRLKGKGKRDEPPMFTYTDVKQMKESKSHFCGIQSIFGVLFFGL